MPITVRWYNDEQKNIQYDLVNVWTWQDLSDAIDEAVLLLDSVDYKVNLIVDCTNTSHMPQVSMTQLRKIANAPTVDHPNTDKFIMIGANKYIQVIFNVFKKIFPLVGERYVIYPDRATLEDILYNKPD